MKAYTKRILILIVGWAFILLGILGLFLPILQGVLFLLVGLIILSSEYVWAHRLLTRLRERFPEDRPHRGPGDREGDGMVTAHYWSTQNGLMLSRGGANLETANRAHG